MNAHVPSNQPISEQIYEAGLQWADADAAARMLESGKSIFIAQRLSEMGDMPVSRAETAVKASPEYRDYVIKMERARTHANKLKLRKEFLESKAWEQRSEAATERVRARL